MATAICTEDTSVCSICYGHFINSRKLPGCNHSFCENCLLTYISTNQESYEENLGEFKCPNCRRTINLLESTEELKDWVKSLEELKAGENMASNAETEGNVNNTICASCKDKDESGLAEKYCVECGQSLCSRCSRISHRTDQFRGHTIVDLQTCTESNKCDRSALQCLSEYLKCNEHPNKYVSVVCMDDAKLCCTECVIENHRHCETFGKIETLSSKSENESTVKKTKDRIEIIVSKIKDLVDLKKQSASENVTELKKKTEILTDKVKEIRTKINTLFDAVEANIASKANAISKQCRIDVGDRSSQLEDISKKLTDYLAVIDQAIRVAPDSHSYIVLRKLESRIEEATMTITEICRDNGKYMVDLKITPAIQNLSTLGTNDADQLAEVIEEFEKILLPDLSDHPRGIEEISCHDILPCNAPVDQPEYYGLVHTRCTSAKHRMLLVCKYGSFFCAVDNNYKATECFNKEKLTGEPYGLTELKHNVIAVGLPEKKRIVFLSENEESKCLELFGHVDTRNNPAGT